MHPEAYDFIRRSLDGLVYDAVLEFGSRDVNGSPRTLVRPNALYVGVDVREGRGVDIVADAATVDLTLEGYDVVICAEVFEHTPRWPEIIVNTYRHLRPGGTFILTCACDPREPHGMDGTYEVPEGEWYRNVNRDEVFPVLVDAGFGSIEIDEHQRGDLYVKARRRAYGT